MSVIQLDNRCVQINQQHKYIGKGIKNVFLPLQSKIRHLQCESYLPHFQVEFIDALYDVKRIHIEE